jgi:hypothetical protein
VANHYRQGGLSLETAFRTQTWWHRVFMSVLGIAVTNAYLMFKTIRERDPSASQVMSFRDFVNATAVALCGDARAAAAAASRVSSAARPAGRRSLGGIVHVDQVAIRRQLSEQGFHCKFERLIDASPARVRVAEPCSCPSHVNI